MRTIPSSMLALCLIVSPLACGKSTKPVGPSEDTHGVLTDMSRVEGDLTFCSHRVPASVCTQHHPELVAQFKRAGDWCAPHGVPESQCYTCHPDLTFEPLPTVAADADIQWLSKEGEDVPNLEAHAAKGKVTIFDFYADWCASCRKVDGHVYKRIADGDTSLAYRKLNIVSWESPVGQRYMKEVPSLPLLLVYGPDGKLAKSLYGADLPALDAAIAEALKR